MAAEHLLADHGGVEAAVGEERLGHRGHQGDPVLGGFFLGLVLGELGLVQLHAHIGGQRPAAFVEGAHGQQHAAHVAVDDDRVGVAAFVLDAGGGAALQALAGVVGGALVAHLTQTQALDADGQALVVHHREHGRQALVGLADDPALGVVEVHYAGGGTLDAHLVFDGAGGDAVALPGVAVGVGQELGHQEQGNALGAGGGVRQLGQHQVDDVVHHVVLTAGDEDLGAGDVVGAVVVGHRLGAHDAQVGAAVRLSEAHGAAPLATVELGQVGLLELFGGVRVQAQGGAVGERRVQRERGVGAVHHLLEQHRQGFGHALATEFRVTGKRAPAVLGVGLEGFLEAFGGGHFAVVEVAALLVAFPVEGEQQVLHHLARFIEDRVGQIAGHLGGGGHGSPELIGLEHIVKDEAHVFQGRFIGGHWHISRNSLVAGR